MLALSQGWTQATIHEDVPLLRKLADVDIECRDEIDRLDGEESVSDAWVM